MLADPRVDLVSIATPPGTHAGLAATALGANKHTVVEIGFVCEAPDARVLATLAGERKRAGVTAYVLRFTPLLRHVSDLLAQNVLGQIRLMRFDSFSNFLAVTEPRYRWIWEAKAGGGILLNFTSHALDLARQWLGPVQEVDATLKTFSPVTLPPGAGALADDTGFATLQFESGALGYFSHSAVTAYPRTRIELHGTTGSIVIEGFGDEASIIQMGETEPRPLFAPPIYLEESLGQSGLVGGFRVFLDRLAERIESGNAPAALPTFADSWETARVIDAIKLSSRARRRVKLTEIEAGWTVK
jgi:predicted dehydrogenase